MTSESNHLSRQVKPLHPHLCFFFLTVILTILNLSGSKVSNLVYCFQGEFSFNFETKSSPILPTKNRQIIQEEGKFSSSLFRLPPSSILNRLNSSEIALQNSSEIALQVTTSEVFVASLTEAVMSQARAFLTFSPLAVLVAEIDQLWTLQSLWERT
jgi:hypothetical protein